MKNLLFKILSFILVFIDGFAQNNSSILNSQQSSEWNIISEVPGSNISEIYFIDSIIGWIIGGDGKIYATEDGGTTWLPQNSGTESPLRSIHFINDKTGFVSGYNRTLIYTNDKGNTWKPVQVVSDSGSIYNCLSSDADNNLYFISNYGEVFCSEDSGANWYNKYNFDNWGFSYLDCSNNPICFAKQMWLGLLYKSTDGGNVWERFSMPSPWFNDTYFLNDDIGWVSENWFLSAAFHDSISIYMTTNGGESWIRQSSLLGIDFFKIVFVDTSRGWTSNVTQIYYTSDSGQSWICQFESDSIGFIADIFFLEDRNGWALTNQGKIIKYGVPIEVSVDKPDNIYSDDYLLNQNYPNPFNPSTTIKYALPKSEHVTITVYNTLGQTIETLINKFMPLGHHQVEFNGQTLPSGVYFYCIEAGEYIQTRKMLLVK